MNYKKTLSIAIIFSVIIHIIFFVMFYLSHKKSDKDIDSEPIEVSLIPKENKSNQLQEYFNDNLTDDEETTLEHDRSSAKKNNTDNNISSVNESNTLNKKINENINKPKTNIQEKHEDIDEKNDNNDILDLSGIFNTKDITDKIAMNKPPQKEGEDSASYNEFEEKYASYFSKFRRRVYQLWRYPQTSVRKGEHGIVKVSFSILKDGSIVNIKMISSSGYPDLDREVMRVLRNIGKIPLPKSYNLEQLNVDEANFIYTIGGSVIRYLN